MNFLILGKMSRPKKNYKTEFKLFQMNYGILLNKEKIKLLMKEKELWRMDGFNMK